jgi:hypothetical protein
MSIDKVFCIWVTQVGNVVVMGEDVVKARGSNVARSS